MHKEICGAFFLFLTACGDSSMNQSMPSVAFTLNDSIDSMLATSSMKLTQDCNSTICFYEFSTSSKSENKGTATIDPGSQPLILNDIVSAAFITQKTGSIDKANIRIAAFPSNSEHTKSLDYFNSTLAKLKAAGWQRYIFPNEARIPGFEARKFNTFDEVLGIPVGTGPWGDPALQLSKADWLSRPTIKSWHFTKGGNYLLFSVHRENSPQAPLELGSYLFSLNFETEVEFYKNFVPNENQDDWVKLLPTELKRMAQERAQTEARLTKMGIAIDEDYQDPPIKALE